MKNLLILLFFFVSVVATAQIKISEMPTLSGNPNGAYLPGIRGGVNYKIAAGNLGYTKMDTAYMRNDSIFGSKYSHEFFIAKLIADTSDWNDKINAKVDSVTTNADSSALYYWVNGDSTKFYDFTQSLLGNDTIPDVDFVDSTGQPQNRVLFAKSGKKIGSDQNFIYGPNVNKLTVGATNVSWGGNDKKLAVKGNGYYSGNLKIGVYTLPNTDGTSGQVLQTNGSGAVSWQTVTAGGSGSFNFDSAFATKTTDNLTEGSTNLYHTTARARAALSVLKAPLSYNSSTGVFDIDTSFVHSLNYYNTIFPRMDGSYSNPSWITGLPWSKITGTPTTISGYGITDAVPTSRTISTTSPLSGGGDLSTNRTLSITAMDATHDGYVTAGGSANKILHGDGTWKDTTAVVQFSGLTNRLPRWSSSTNISYFDSIFTNNTYPAFPRIGFGLVPQHTLAFDSARSIAYSGAGNGNVNSGVLFHFRRDTVNALFMKMGFSSLNSKFYMNIGAAGTQSATGGVISINGTEFTVGGTLVTNFFQAAGGNYNGTSNIANARCTVISGSSGSTTSFQHAFNTSSGAGIGNDMVGSVNQTGTAGYTELRISPNIGTIGSGAYKLLDVGTNSSTFGTGTHTSYFNVDKSGVSTFAKPLAFSTGTPSYTAGTGAGTSPTISITGNDAAGYITITTGTSPTASGNIVTITFSTALTNTPTSIQLTPAGENAATESTKFYVDQSTASSTSWIIKNTSSALTASTTYKFYYTVTQ